MKTYIKPCIEELIVDAMDQILADSGPGIYDEVGDTGNQGAPRRKVYIEDDWEDDEPDFGW